MSDERFAWWGNLLHGGLLLDAPRLTALVGAEPAELSFYDQERLRRRLTQFQDDPAEHRGQLVAFVLETICGFKRPLGEWSRGGEVPAGWSRKALTGEAVRPRHLWIGPTGAVLPVFVDGQPRLGVGKGRGGVSRVLGWLRQGPEQLALVTNGRQWRLLFAGLDYEAFCQWDAERWFAEGGASPELAGLRALVSPPLWTPAKEGEACRLLAAVNDSRKGQADLSQILGERVRQAAELLVQAHTPALKDHLDQFAPQDIYRAAVRMIMRLVVVLFAESRPGLLARDNPVFHGAYSLQGLREQLERVAAYKLASGGGAWPRVLALVQLIYRGCDHEALPVPAYGGELFAPGRPDDADGMKRVLHLFETACFGTHHESVMTDHHVQRILDLLTRTKIKLRQGRANMLVAAPVDFSSLDSEYIGILYEGLLDFELRSAVEDEPIVFLAVGSQPALPLATLEQMDDRAIKNLLEKFTDASPADDDESAAGETEGDAAEDDAVEEEIVEQDEAEEEIGDDEIVGRGGGGGGGGGAGGPPPPAPPPPPPPRPTEIEPTADPRLSLRSRAEAWARRACQVGGLVRSPRGRATPENQARFERELAGKAKRLIVKVVLPGEWYLVRWGGTRKGSGTFYTRPQLAVPTVHRTLRPLAYDPPSDAAGLPDLLAPAESWTPKKPEAILALKVCDPACGSGSFPLAALRFLTNALYESLLVHGRVRDHGGRAVLDLIRDASVGRAAGPSSGTDGSASRPTDNLLAGEALPCRPDDDDFEPRTRAILRRYVVERCIYGVDLDPLAVELCRLSLWIETLDGSLPLTFLNHKIKSGNSLVGAWFDQFMHYPAMAWEREGGDKNHANGVHFAREGWTRAIKDFKARVKSDLIKFIDGGVLNYYTDLTAVRTGHDAAERALAEIHEMGIEKAAQRAARYEALVSDPDFQRLKAAFDLWCALWFWPADRLDHAPLPTQFAAGEIDDLGRDIARQVAHEQRFFHWELEFPDVFNLSSHGFDAVLGNPPWDIAKPNSKEFFSAIDPLYRGYGKQEAVAKQSEYFHRDAGAERRWLDYNAAFKATGNWVKYAGFPFGDRLSAKPDGREEHDLNLGDRGRASFASSARRHARFKQKREETSGYVDADHAFRHQGSADINLYKLFLEQAHALLAPAGRLGLIVPSGLYSDFGTGDLRRLFVDGCRWEWLFGFENRDKVFDIDSRFKFNPVIVAKGGRTTAIRTAFMRRKLADWERAEELAVDYTRAQVVEFSPKSRAILEIQSRRDLEVLTKIYANSVLLGDQSERGWGIKYATEFHMTNDSKLFPPRPKWEEWGYRPDEYSRWIKGPWQPIERLYAELGVRVPAEGERRCAQPPYDRLPLPRADLPAGVLLSRGATHYLHEDQIPIVTFTDAAGRALKVRRPRPSGGSEEVEVVGPAVALPLYEGRMIGQFDFSEKGWVSGAGRSAVWASDAWEAKAVNPQYLMATPAFHAMRELSPAAEWLRRLAFMDIASATNKRTMIGSPLPGFPCGNSAPVFVSRHESCGLAGILDSFVFDAIARLRCTGLHLNWFVVEEAPLPVPARPEFAALFQLVRALTCGCAAMAPYWQCRTSGAWRRNWAISPHERLRRVAEVQAVAAVAFGVFGDDLLHLFIECDRPISAGLGTNPKGFWRIDKEKHPEHRQTILSLVAFHDLEEKIASCGGDVARGIEAFCGQNEGQGWLLPETLRLADYGLGHDARAREHQPVRACFGPRFYDWQLAQSAEESWRECHLHARNLLGAAGYAALLAELSGAPPAPPPDHRGRLFETESLPLFDSDGGE